MELHRFYSLPANTKPYLGGGESGLDVHRNDGKGWDGMGWDVLQGCIIQASLFLCLMV